MPCSHMVSTSVYSDKYTVSPTSGKIPTIDQVASCPSFKQISETVETVRAVSCDEMVAFTGSAVDYCAAAATSLRAANAQAIATKETGKKVTLCNGSGASKQP